MRDKKLYTVVSGRGIEGIPWQRRGLLHYQIPRNIELGRKSLQGFDDYDAYSDSERLSCSFREIDKDYPNSRFVLNTRDVNRWLVSRLNHGDGTYVDFVNEFEGKNLTWQEWVELWRTQFIEHEAQVIEYFRGRDDMFLRYDIEADQLDKFNEFIGLELLPGRPAGRICRMLV